MFEPEPRKETQYKELKEVGFGETFKPFGGWTGEDFSKRAKTKDFDGQGDNRYSLEEWELKGVGPVEVNLDSVFEGSRPGTNTCWKDVISVDERVTVPPDFYVFEVQVSPKNTRDETGKVMKCKLSAPWFGTYTAESNPEDDSYFFCGWKPEGEADSRDVCFQLNPELLNEIEIEFSQPE